MRHDSYHGEMNTRRRPTTRSETCRSFSCMPPWFMLWRWFNGWETGDSMERKLEKEKMEGNSDVINRRNGKANGGSRDRVESSSSSSPSSSSSSSSSREDDVSVPAEISKETSFNLGVGFGLIYFVRDELNKMVELRQNIELLLQELRNQDKKPLSMPSKSSSSASSSFSNTGVQETSYPEENNSYQHLSSHDAERPGTCFSSNRYRREKSLRMDQLEAELEAEFDRLQITSDCYKYSKQQYSEVNVEDSAPELSLNVCNEEDNEYGPHDEFYGVSPRELERKLHEVLVTRQQERINELETALEYAMQQLEEKERELACWKDAARFVSRHFSAAVPGLLMQVKQDGYCMEPEFEAMETSKSLVKSNIGKCG